MADPRLMADPLVYALTGCLAATGGGAVSERLAQIGWDADRVQDFVAARHAARLPWPLPVPGELITGGYAAFTAELVDARAALGLLGPEAVPQPVRQLTADERRLVSERPPHWG